MSRVCRSMSFASVSVAYRHRWPASRRCWYGPTATSRGRAGNWHPHQISKYNSQNGSRGKVMTDRRILITGGWIVSMDPAIGDFTRGDLLIEGERIVELAPRIDVADADRVDAAGMIVTPGFVDTHRHTWQSCMRHRYADIASHIYFAQMLGTIGAAYRTEDVYIGTLLGAVSALDSGITTMLDWAHVQNTPAHSDAAIEALRDAGIRGIFGHGWPLIDGASWMSDSQRSHPQDIRRLRSRYFSTNDQLFTLAMAARGSEMAQQNLS